MKSPTRRSALEGEVGGMEDRPGVDVYYAVRSEGNGSPWKMVSIVTINLDSIMIL